MCLFNPLPAYTGIKVYCLVAEVNVNERLVPRLHSTVQWFALNPWSQFRDRPILWSPILTASRRIRDLSRSWRMIRSGLVGALIDWLRWSFLRQHFRWRWRKLFFSCFHTVLTQNMLTVTRHSLIHFYSAIWYFIFNFISLLQKNLFITRNTFSMKILVHLQMLTVCTRYC